MRLQWQNAPFSPAVADAFITDMISGFKCAVDGLLHIYFHRQCTVFG